MTLLSQTPSTRLTSSDVVFGRAAIIKGLSGDVVGAREGGPGEAALKLESVSLSRVAITNQKSNERSFKTTYEFYLFYLQFFFIMPSIINNPISKVVSLSSSWIQ